MANIKFTIGDPGYPPDGATSYYNPILAGKKLKVFREGQYQYRIGQNFIIAPGTGSILFSPALWMGERIRIQTV
jgi:hypothetical protein